jgi:hypothetical protein
VDEKEVNLKFIHNVEHVKEKSKGISLEIRLEKSEQF